ncbi:MarR family transcriptional regulator [Brevibacillus thermoruber]|jgi:MarR family transcriptional regulator, organic hydroperoxide resistance regulator|uniref:MarR family transcriptional regulator n=1 Tax=Brevibacillus thermoruber TaxID=33942 RepID=A0A9X3TTH5_9BACL|nr:MarR family transcriptional regulator [Brevibacillus thermoruber]MDA5110306.1 MarR family transcriptional regulator [Brevibacillus thermoruber]
MDQKDLDQAIERLQIAFSTTMRKLGPELAESSADLTGPQFYILSLLSKKGPRSVTELADNMCVKPSAITAMVDRLLKHGFVQRDRDEHDRRVVTIRLTEQGAAILQQAKRKRKEVVQRYLRHLTPDELDALVRLFEKLARIATHEKE